MTFLYSLYSELTLSLLVAHFSNPPTSLALILLFSSFFLFLFPVSDYLPPLLSFLASVSSPCKANRTKELKLKLTYEREHRSLSFWA